MKIQFDMSEVQREQQFVASLPPRVKKRIWAHIRIVSFNAERFIKIRMPVDTGRARASWGHAAAPAGLDEGIWSEHEDTLTIVQGSRVEYIEYLNEGSSTQAPAGFIDAEEAKAANDLEKRIADEIASMWR